MSDARRDDWRTPDGADVELPTHVVAHLSDTHLTSAGVRYNDVLDADASLAGAVAVLAEALRAGRRLDAIVLSGDLTDTGDPDAYRRLREAIGGLTDSDGGAPAVVYATGNHDVRVQFHRSLLGRHDTDAPILQVQDCRGLRFITLDSTVPGRGDGELHPDHIAALRAELASPAASGTVVVLHHAPLPPPSPLLSYFALHRTSRRALADTIAGTDVRLVLAGHHHLAQSGTLAGVPVAAAGSVTIRTDPLAPAGHERTFASGAFNLVEFYEAGAVVSVIPVDGARRVFDLDAAECARIIDSLREERSA